MPLSLSLGQSSAISSEAARFLQNVPTIPFAGVLSPFIARPSRVPSMRAQFQKGEDVVEENIIAKYNLSVNTITLGDVPVLVISPPKPTDPSRIIYNVHGGGFMLGTARDRTALLFAAEMNMIVYSVDYTLAPEAKYPVAQNQCLTVYSELIQKFDPQHILGLSSSAGVPLIIAVLNRARSEKLPMIAGLALFAPATDISGAGDSLTFNESRDVMPPILSLELVRQNYLGTADPKDPLVSPIFAEYGPHFPPTVMITGTRDVMMSGAVRFYWKLREVKVQVEILIMEGMWHGFNWEPDLPEAIQVRSAVRKFLQELIK
jgi:monoterpene epsilon-lactone hydrolase